MSIQKKSLISTLKTTKKANVASAPVSTEVKPATAQNMKSLKAPAHSSQSFKSLKKADFKSLKRANLKSFKRANLKSLKRA
jgi:hypothetical protein